MERDRRTLAHQADYVYTVLAWPFKILLREPMLIASTLNKSVSLFGVAVAVTMVRILKTLFCRAAHTVPVLHSNIVDIYKRETRLQMSLFASPLFAISFFVFGWVVVKTCRRKEVCSDFYNPRLDLLPSCHVLATNAYWCPDALLFASLKEALDPSIDGS